MLPSDSQDASYTVEVKAVQSCFMMGVSFPCFTAVQQGAEDARSVDADLSCQGKLPVLPYTFAEPQHGH